MTARRRVVAAWRSAAVVCSLVAIAEVISYFAIARVAGAPISLAALDARKAEIASATERARLDSPPLARRALGAAVVHPYLGFVAGGAGPLGDQSLGFGEREPVVRRRSPDRLLVAITGGSLARRVIEIADEVLAPPLASSPALAGREIAIVPLANREWKQPQSLLALAYLLALGGELDVLIEVDAWDELAASASESRELGVHPAFPNGWPELARSLPDPIALPILARVAYLETVRADTARLLSRAPLRWSAAAGWFWLARDRALRSDIAHARDMLEGRSAQPRAAAAMGGPTRFASDRAVVEQRISVWSRSVAQLSRLAASNGIAHLHLVPAGAASDPSGGGDPGGARRLRDACRRLAARGVPCHELAELRAGDDALLARDGELLGSRIARIALEAIESRR